MNIPFLIVGHIVGKSIDWILQSQSQAEKKTKDIWTLVQHSFVYASFTSTITLSLINEATLSNFAVVFWLLFLSHMVIDDRNLVKIIMYTKGISIDEMDTKYGWLQISIDQRLHELCILFLALLI